MANVEEQFIDLSCENAIKDAAANIEKESLDMVIVASGILHDENFSPEKTIKNLHSNLLQLSDITKCGIKYFIYYWVREKIKSL